MEATFVLTEQFRNELMSALHAETVETCFGEIPRYEYVDFDADALEVYCYDMKDWNLYGFTYSMDGDNVLIDFESKKRKKFAIVDFNEGEQISPMSNMFELVSERHNDIVTDLQAKFDAEHDRADQMETELTTLREFKASTEAAQMKEARENLFAKFADLNEVEGFAALQENDELSLDELEEKCFALRGRHQTMNFSAQSNAQEHGAPKLRVGPNDEDSADDNEPYGGLFCQYGNH